MNPPPSSTAFVQPTCAISQIINQNVATKADKRNFEKNLEDNQEEEEEVIFSMIPRPDVSLPASETAPNDHKEPDVSFKDDDDDEVLFLEEKLKVTNTNTKLYNCPKCIKTFLVKRAWICHMRNHASLKPHICSICQHGFTQRTNLTTHMRIHTGEKPYTCPTCGAAFSQQNNLSTHQRGRHTGERPFRCGVVNCGKTFRLKQHLKAHHRTHIGDRPFQCGVCLVRFTQSSNLKYHQKTKKHQAEEQRWHGVKKSKT